MPVDSDFGCFFKAAVILAVVLAVFGFVFISSTTLELRYEDFTRNGMPYKKTHYIFHWDRFGGYVKSIPSRIKRIFVKPEPAPVK